MKKERKEGRGAEEGEEVQSVCCTCTLWPPTVAVMKIWVWGLFVGTFSHSTSQRDEGIAGALKRLTVAAFLALLSTGGPKRAFYLQVIWRAGHFFLHLTKIGMYDYCLIYNVSTFIITNEVARWRGG